MDGYEDDLRNLASEQSKHRNNINKTREDIERVQKVLQKVPQTPPDMFNEQLVLHFIYVPVTIRRMKLLVRCAQSMSNASV